MDNNDRRLERLAEIRQRFGRVSNISVFSRDLKKNGFKFAVPGFKFDDFDRAGHSSHHKIVKLLETERYVRKGHFAASLGDMDFVMLGYNIEIMLELYEHAAVDYQMHLECYMTHVGKSSISATQRLTHASTGNLLAKRSYTAVNVDLTGASLKTLPIPDAIRDIFHVKNKPLGPPPQMLQPITTYPARCFTCSVVVRTDETDLFQHTTQASYTLYLVECALQASMAKFYRIVNEFSLLHRAKLRFAHETYAGDELTITTWEDDDNPLIIRVFITRVKDGRDSCYSEMEYYPSTMTSRL